MILDTVEHWKANKSQYGAVIRKALDFTFGLDMTRVDGKIQMVEGKMFVFRAEGKTESWDCRKGECHDKHADIHIILEGEEGFGYAPASNSNEKVTDQLEEQDYALFGYMENEQRVMLKSGMFVVFWPGEVHRPGCSDSGKGSFVKLVVKIHESLFADPEGANL